MTGNEVLFIAGNGRWCEKPQPGPTRLNQFHTDLNFRRKKALSVNPFFRTKPPKSGIDEDKELPHPPSSMTKSKNLDNIQTHSQDHYPLPIATETLCGDESGNSTVFPLTGSQDTMSTSSQLVNIETIQEGAEFILRSGFKSGESGLSTDEDSRGRGSSKQSTDRSYLETDTPLNPNKGMSIVENSAKRRVEEQARNQENVEERHETETPWWTFLADMGANYNMIKKSVAESEWGEGCFTPYEEPLLVGSLSGEAVRSVGRTHLFFTFEGDNHQNSCCEKFEVIDDSKHKVPLSFDAMFGRETLDAYPLLRHMEQVKFMTPPPRSKSILTMRRKDLVTGMQRLER